MPTNFIPIARRLRASGQRRVPSTPHETEIGMMSRRSRGMQTANSTRASLRWLFIIVTRCRLPPASSGLSSNMRAHAICLKSQANSSCRSFFGNRQSDGAPMRRGADHIDAAGYCPASSLAKPEGYSVAAKLLIERFQHGMTSADDLSRERKGILAR